MLLIKACDTYLCSAANCCTKLDEYHCGITYRTNS